MKGQGQKLHEKLQKSKVTESQNQSEKIWMEKHQNKKSVTQKKKKKTKVKNR